MIDCDRENEFTSLDEPHLSYFFYFICSQYVDWPNVKGRAFLFIVLHVLHCYCEMEEKPTRVLRNTPLKTSPWGSWSNRECKYNDIDMIYYDLFQYSNT